MFDEVESAVTTSNMQYLPVDLSISLVTWVQHIKAWSNTVVISDTFHIMYIIDHHVFTFKIGFAIKSSIDIFYFNLGNYLIWRNHAAWSFGFAPYPLENCGDQNVSGYLPPFFLSVLLTITVALLHPDYVLVSFYYIAKARDTGYNRLKKWARN